VEVRLRVCFEVSVFLGVVLAIRFPVEIHVVSVHGHNDPNHPVAAKLLGYTENDRPQLGCIG